MVTTMARLHWQQCRFHLVILSHSLRCSTTTFWKIFHCKLTSELRHFPTNAVTLSAKKLNQIQSCTYGFKRVKIWNRVSINFQSSFQDYSAQWNLQNTPGLIDLMEQKKVISRGATLQPASPGVEGKHLLDTDYGDDMALWYSTLKELQETTNFLCKYSANAGKTQSMAVCKSASQRL